MESTESQNAVTLCQHEVQRKLGRCLIRLQQVELLVKSLWIDHEHSGYPLRQDSCLFGLI